jgi:hypothetical protein
MGNKIKNSGEKPIGGGGRLWRNLDALIAILLGFLDLIYAQYHFWYKAESNEEHFSLLILTGIGIIFGFAGYERIKQREKIERKFEVLKEVIEKQKLDLSCLEYVISGYELISGIDNITISAKDGIKKAEQIIRSTSFIPSAGTTDVGPEYFRELAGRIKNNRLIYCCCFSENYDFTERKRIFKEQNFDEKDYGRMHYIKFLKSGVPNFDFIIIDKKTVFIAFPTLAPEMELMIKIEGITKQNQEVINGLCNWYDELLKIKGIPIADTRKFFEEYPNAKGKRK